MITQRTAYSRRQKPDTLAHRPRFAMGAVIIALLIAGKGEVASGAGPAAEADTPTAQTRVSVGMQPADTGVLRIKGQFVKSLVLQCSDPDSRRPIHLESPESEVRLPAGTYNWQQVVLQDGKSPRFVSWGYYSSSLEITAGETTTLTIGGPLKQQLQATPRGAVVNLNFNLIGIGGETYTREDRRDPPRFTVIRGGRQIAEAAFAYG